MMQASLYQRLPLEGYKIETKHIAAAAAHKDAG
jgi:hypothetical protein